MRIDRLERLLKDTGTVLKKQVLEFNFPSPNNGNPDWPRASCDGIGIFEPILFVRGGIPCLCVPSQVPFRFGTKLCWLEKLRVKRATPQPGLGWLQCASGAADFRGRATRSFHLLRHDRIVVQCERKPKIRVMMLNKC